MTKALSLRHFVFSDSDRAQPDTVSDRQPRDKTLLYSLA